MLLYAASPLFNGNAMYADFKNPMVRFLSIPHLMPPNGLVQKAAKDAIDAAEAIGCRLYQPTDATDTSLPEPADPTQRALRFTLVDKASKETVWIDARDEGFYSLQKQIKTFYANHAWNGICPTLAMLDRFYTENGLPINEDPAFDYEGRFAPLFS